MMRPLDSYNKTWLGVIAVAVVAVLIGALLLVKELGIGYRQFTGEFLQAAALRPGNIVAVAGVQVGSVTGVRLSGDRVEVTFRVRDNVPVGTDSRAAIKITTLFGSRYVDLRPAGAAALDGRRISLPHTEVPYDLQAALADSTRTFEQVDADRIASSLGVLGTQLDGLPNVVPQAMENVRALSSVIAQRREQLGTLLTSTEKVTGMLRRQQSDIGTFIRQGQELVGEFVARSAAFHAMMRSLQSIVASLRTIVVGDHRALDGVIQTLEELSGKLAEQDALLRNLLQIAPVPIREIANATGLGNSIEGNPPGGALIDSWMCAISGRAKQFGMLQYFKDCQ
ncbi:putative Mce family protein [Mycobacteroides stephanolepidis]|uniref:Putative Mce family protein n=1 Tax=[Mycobacterium] stephanolepidis TaxID=1520670 RepID=A0A1Z4EVP8_9MYCO|nr:MCE family protein [[Mycobacterium] stephanolepidis]BAX97017.1 putative Mce family protein [[Mycobacterium] stephanolepidis]